MPFSSADYPERLTPPIEDYAEELDSPPSQRPVAPLRKSIYAHPHKPIWYATVQQYSDEWPHQFARIRDHLHHVFTTSQPVTPYLSIEHVGSTAVEGLAAKPNIDVLVTFASDADLELAVEALNWEIPSQPSFVRYTQVFPRGGGLPGRESYKLYLNENDPYYTCTPERSVYLIADTEANVAGRTHIRVYRTVVDVLGKLENKDLFDEYANFKLALSQQEFDTGIGYSEAKTGIVRKILLRGDWTVDEVDAKEKLAKRDWTNDKGEEACY